MTIRAMGETASSAFWRRTRRLTAALLALWLLVNLLGPWFARSLNELHIAGVPLGYWLAAQGLLGFYLVVIVVYVVWMNRLESRLRDASQPADDDKGPE